MKKKNFKYYLAGAVGLLTFVVYLSSLRNAFVLWDDNWYVYENPHIRSFDLAFLKWTFFDFYAANWHPLTWISHALDYAVWGLNPMGHHLTNNILHAVNAFLVVLLVVRLLERVNLRSSCDSRLTIHDSRFTLIAAGTTGLLFGLHPIHVESVAWVAERKDLLCALFFLLSIMMYTAYMRHRTFRSYLLSLSFFTLALLSKPMAVSLPLVLLILDWYPFGRIKSFETFKASITEKLPFFALSIVSSVLTVLAQNAGGALKSVEFIPLSSRAPVAAKSLISYLWQMIAPVHLSPYYPYPKDVSLFSAEYLSSIVLTVVITVTCVMMMRKQKLLLSVWIYYVLTLIPILGFVQVGDQAMADRYMYLPSLGPFLILGLLAASVSEKITMLKRPSLSLKLIGPSVALLILGYLGFLTFENISIWKDSFTLWSYVIEREPERVPLAYNNRGFVFKQRGEFDRAVEDYDKAIALNPSYCEAYYNRGTVFEKMEQPGKAMEDYTTAIALNPLFYLAYNNRGILYGRAGLFDEAIEDFNKAIAINPMHINAYYNRGVTFTLIGENDRALEDLSKVLESGQYHAIAEVYVDRGMLYLEKGDKELAISDFQNACDLGEEKGCNALQSLRFR